MTSRTYYLLDVFTDEPFRGNPLAVVTDADGLDQAQMQAIAREFNSAVTAFVTATPDKATDADVRLFTPDRNIAFASQPTVGVAVLLEYLVGKGSGRAPRTYRLQQDVGVVECTAELLGPLTGRGRFAFPTIPQSMNVRKDNAACALALGVEPGEIGFDAHAPSRYASSVTYNMVPVASLEALACIKLREDGFFSAFGDTPRPYLYAYARMAGKDSYRARMFWPGPGGPLAEDPASASGAVTLAASLLQHGIADGIHDIVVEQGYEMGRSSDIHVRLTVRDGAFVSAEIIGTAILVCKGELMH